MLKLEVIASFLLILSVYFLGSLAMMQDIIRPQKQLVMVREAKKQYLITNYTKILFWSFAISLPTSCLAFFLFV